VISIDIIGEMFSNELIDTQRTPQLREQIVQQVTMTRKTVVFVCTMQCVMKPFRMDMINQRIRMLHFSQRVSQFGMNLMTNPHLMILTSQGQPFLRVLSQ
jgi:hypothetical protein